MTEPNDRRNRAAQMMSASEQRNWVVAAHAGPLVAMLLSMGIASWLVPLAIWLLKRDECHWVGAQAKEALNFQVTILFGIIVGIALTVAGIMNGQPAGSGFGAAIVGGLGLVNIVFALIAAAEANKGVSYRYPFNFRLL